MTLFVTGAPPASRSLPLLGHWGVDHASALVLTPVHCGRDGTGGRRGVGAAIPAAVATPSPARAA